jgi:hypothetical protein
LPPLFAPLRRRELLGLISKEGLLRRGEVCGKARGFLEAIGIFEKPNRRAFKPMVKPPGGSNADDPPGGQGLL